MSIERPFFMVNAQVSGGYLLARGRGPL